MIMKLRCSECGIEIDAACECGVNYIHIPAAKVALKAINKYPEKSARLLAEEFGISKDTIIRVKNNISENQEATVAFATIAPENPKEEKLIGKDGKFRSAKRKSAIERAKETLGISVDLSKVKIILPEKVILTEKMIAKYEEDLETVAQIQIRLIKFGVQADQLHPLRRQEYASQLKTQRDMWEMIAKNMIGSDNLRNIKAPYCNINVPFFREEPVN
jgi:hypothetical protein